MSRMSEIALFLEDHAGQYMTKNEIVNEVGAAGFEYLMETAWLKHTELGYRVDAVKLGVGV